MHYSKTTHKQGSVKKGALKQSPLEPDDVFNGKSKFGELS